MIERSGTDDRAGTATSDDVATADDRSAETTGDTLPRIVLGGVLGGLVGAVAFGLLMWVANPSFLQTSIPALYGLEPQGTLGWTAHMLHGVVLGLVFAVVVSRPAIGSLVVSDSPDPEDPEIGPAGIVPRLTALGLAYGLAIWAIFPMLVMPVWLGVVGTRGLAGIPAIPVESLVGHAVFGLLLGAVYAIVARRR